MIFSTPLLKGTLIKRYKRFLADICLEDGTVITAHCANSGAMLDITTPGLPVWVSEENSPTRKLKYSWHIVDADNTLIGMNTSWPNVLVTEGIHAQIIEPLKGYATLKREVKYGSNSRIDILLDDPLKGLCYVEVKNAHLKQKNRALFPDSVTARGTKHLLEMAEEVKKGNRAVMIYVVQREDCTSFSLASHIDPTYAQTALHAFSQGVEAYAFSCKITPQEIILAHPLEIIFPLHLD